MTLWTVACQTPLSRGFPRQEYWHGLPFLSPGDLPAPGIKRVSSALAGRFFTTGPPGKPLIPSYLKVIKILPILMFCSFQHSVSCFVACHSSICKKGFISEMKRLREVVCSPLGHTAGEQHKRY